MESAKATLDTLPEELLVAILEHITTLPTLLALSKTSRRLHRLSLPQLYHTFPGRNSELFLRTISHSPDLAVHTKTAIWHQERRTVPSIDLLEKQHIVMRLAQLCVPHGTDLAQHFSNFGKHEDYWYFEVLVLFMPSLEEVQVRESWLWDDHQYWFKSLSPFFNPLCESRLRTARLDGPMRLENLVPLLTIPTLRTLEVTQVTVMRREGFRVFQWSVWPVEKLLAERSSGLETLSLRESYIDLELLLPLLRGVKALKSFTYEHLPNDLVDEFVLEQRVEDGALAACLAVQRESLEYIRVRDTEERDLIGMPQLLFDPESDYDAAHNIGKAFPNLHTLDIGPLKCIWHQINHGHETSVLKLLMANLPPSIKILRFVASPTHHKDLERLLDILAYAFATEQRPLQAIEIMDWDPTLGWFPENLPILQKTYSVLGLRLISVARNAIDVYGAEPLLIDEDTEPDWIFVTDLRLASQV